MFRNDIFDGMFIVRYFVSAFMPRKIPHSMPSDPFELVRRWFEAFNAGDLDGLAALYHEDSTNDSGAGMARGRDAVRQEFAAALDQSPRRHVRMIARVETGAMHAEWRGQTTGEGGR